MGGKSSQPVASHGGSDSPSTMSQPYLHAKAKSLAAKVAEAPKPYQTRTYLVWYDRPEQFEAVEKALSVCCPVRTFVGDEGRQLLTKDSPAPGSPDQVYLCRDVLYHVPQMKTRRYELDKQSGSYLYCERNDHFDVVDEKQRDIVDRVPAADRVDLTKLTDQDKADPVMWLELVRDKQAAPEIRADALTEFMSFGDSHRLLPAFLIEEFDRPDLDPAWRDRLVLVAEEIQFSDDQQKHLLPRLMHIALALRDEAGGRPNPVLWAALRRCSGMMPEDEAGQWLQFLRPQDSLANAAARETDDEDGVLQFLRPQDSLANRQAALQGVQTVFSLAPPRDGERLRSLRDELAALAQQYLDPTVLVPGEQGAFALNLLRALAVLGDERVPVFARQFVQSAKRWAIDLARTSLEEIRESWRSGSLSAVESHPAWRPLIDSIAILNGADNPSGAASPPFAANN